MSNDERHVPALPVGQQLFLQRRLWRFLLLLAVLVCLAAAWKWTSLGDWLEIGRVTEALRSTGRKFGPPGAIAAFAAACVVVVPLTFLTLVAIIAFGPLLGFVYTLVGACIGAAVSYGLGRLLGREVMLRMAGARVNMLSRRLAGRGMLAVIAVRMVPIAPFAIVNLIAGTSHIRFKDFMLGTALGMTPGTLAMMFFVDQILISFLAK